MTALSSSTEASVYNTASKEQTTNPISPNTAGIKIIGTRIFRKGGIEEWVKTGQSPYPPAFTPDPPRKASKVSAIAERSPLLRSEVARSARPSSNIKPGTFLHFMAIAVGIMLFISTLILGSPVVWVGITFGITFLLIALMSALHYPRD